MCQNPVLLPNGIEVACHQCWQCKKNRVNDWVGRCIAESQTAKGVTVVTLTYGRDEHIGAADHVKAAVLTYSDVQRYLRAYRDYRGDDASHGFPLRYFAVGEYGREKSRAHWHVVCFWQDKVPQREQHKRFMDEPFWPHGLSYWDTLTTREGVAKAVKYAAKYVAKELADDERQAYMGLSRMPALGHYFFVEYARKHVEQGIAPQDPFYSFPDIRDKHGLRPIQFRLSGTSLETYLRSFCQIWAEERPDQHIPPSELVENYLDMVSKRGSAERSRAILAAEKLGVRDPHTKLFKFQGTVKKPSREDMRPWMREENLYWSETLHHWLYAFEGEQTPWYWARNPEGVWGWRAKPGSGVGARRSESPTTYQEQRA